jgi:Zn ribbon nucleic-acid-binding protein
MNTVNRLYKENNINVGEVMICGWNNKKPTDTAVWEENKRCYSWKVKQTINKAGQSVGEPSPLCSI